MIAITGANGNLGKATISFLLKKTNPGNIIAVVRDPAKIQDLQHTGIKIRVADYNDVASLNEAFKGTEKVMQVSSAGFGAEAITQETNVVKAAKQQKVKHIVYISTLKPGDNAIFMAGRTCGNTEKAIIDAGLGYTFFRNSMYMETIPLFIGTALQDGSIQYPVGDGKVSFVSRIDIAEALSNVLAADYTGNAVHSITGDKAHTFQDIADLLRSEKGLPGSYTDIPAEALREALTEAQMPAGEIDFYISMADSVRANEFSGADPQLEQLLQRKRLTLQEYMRSL